MGEDGPSPPETVLCGRCATVCDPEDNFCRHCGLSLHDETRLPSVRDERPMPVAWQPPLRRALVRGAAFIAAGTLAELLARRLVRRALGWRPGAARSSKARLPTTVRDSGQSVPTETRVESETLLFRRVRLRR